LIRKLLLGYLVGIATGLYGLEDRGSIPGRGKRFFSSPQRPDRLWGPSSLLSNGYRGLSPVPRLRMVELYLQFPIYLQSIVLNYIIK
jgi:hypothetical protein